MEAVCLPECSLFLHIPDAIRDLECSNAERAALEKELKTVRNSLEFSVEENMELQGQLRESRNTSEEMSTKFALVASELRMVEDSLSKAQKEKLDGLEACAKLLLGETLELKEEQRIRDLITRYLPHLELVEKTSITESSFLPPIVEATEPAPRSPSKIPARIFRRKMRKPSTDALSEETMIEKHKREVKSLEDDLFAAHEKNKKLSAEIDQIRSASSDPSNVSNSIVSIKVVNESAVQTDTNHLVADNNLLSPPVNGKILTSCLDIFS